MKELRGRSAIVTGASRGIGVYIARALAAEGMNLVLSARSSDLLEEVRVEVLAAGAVQAAAVRADVAELKDLENLVEQTSRHFGGCDVLVNNAGIETVFSFHKLEPSEIDDVLNVNLRGAMHLTRLVLPGMFERGRGHIVNHASLAGLAGPAFCEPYAATKAGLIGFTQSLRASYRGTGVSASVICPGFVEAGMYARARAEEAGAVSTALVSRPEAVAGAVVRAIKGDRFQVLVNPLPVRPLMALSAIAPGVAERLTRLFDANELFRRQAELRQQARERVSSA